MHNGGQSHTGSDQMRASRGVVVVVSTSAASVGVAHAGFTNVINSPPDPLPMNGLIGGVVGETTQLNLLDTGFIPSGFLVAFGGELNVNGGDVDTNLGIDNGGVVNLNAGSIGDLLFPLPGSTLNITGGSVNGLIQADNATINITGGDFPGFIVARNNTVVNISGGTTASELTPNTLSIESGSTAHLSVLEARVGGAFGRTHEKPFRPWKR
ncbi:MAG: hypothetical protein Tsb0013_16670 [Phycisphaerales bacterium]